jgi:nucleoside-diphosphate-sugar epimerase
MTQRILVTGATGCLGRAVAARATAAGDEVVGVARSERPGPWQRFVAVDVGDEVALRARLREIRPDVVVHAAGQLRGTPAELLAANAAPIPGLCEALHAANPAARLVVVGSSAEYGSGRQDGGGTDERWPCAPDRPYGVSKLVATKTALAHGERLGLRVRVARLANLIGPGLSPQLAAGTVVAQAAACRAGSQPLRVALGDTSARRDFLDVDDAARGVLAIAAYAGPMVVFNLCRGECHTIADVVAARAAIAGERIDVVAAPAPPPAGPAIVRLGGRAAAAALAFQARVSLELSLAAAWRAAVAAPIAGAHG